MEQIIKNNLGYIRADIKIIMARYPFDQLRKDLKEVYDKLCVEYLNCPDGEGKKAWYKKHEVKSSSVSSHTIEEEIKQKEIYDSFEEDPSDPQIDNPTHYQSMVAGLDIDAISCMRAAFGDNDVKAFCLCNSMKYIFRSSSKGQNQSIAKAIWYLNKFLELGGYD